MAVNNLYFNLVDNSIKLFKEAQEKSINYLKENRNSEVRQAWNNVIDLSRTATMVPSYEDFHLESVEKSAVIITGLSCTGKTTIARTLSKKYPNFETIVFDKIGLTLLKENMIKYYATNMSTLDDDMLLRMGEILENVSKSRKNLIIEGEYCPLNVRGALYKALRIFGYKKIYLITTLNIPYEVERDCAVNRALLYCYSDRLNPEESLEFKLRSFDEDVIPIIEKNVDINRLKKTGRFLKNVHEVEIARKDEFLSDMILIQREYNLLYAGADYVTNWF